MDRPLTAGEALRELVESADKIEAEARRVGIWRDENPGPTESLIRGIQGYRAVLAASASDEGSLDRERLADRLHELFCVPPEDGWPENSWAADDFRALRATPSPSEPEKP